MINPIPNIHKSVTDNWLKFSENKEGRLGYMYQDVKGLVTVGVGNLIDPMSYATGLPFVRADGTPATREEIANEWRRIKADPTLAKAGHLAAKRIATLRLTEDSIDDLVNRKLAEMVGHLVKRFPDLATWPADAQMGLLSMSWAMGPAFRFPKFEAACKRRDFAAAAKECRIRDGNKDRNDDNRKCFENAAKSEADKYFPEELFWPGAVPE